MQILNIFGLIVALVTIACAEVTLKSEKITRTRDISPRADLYSMPFNVKLDHFSPQDERMVTFVSTYIKFIYMKAGTKCSNKMFRPTFKTWKTIMLADPFSFTLTMLESLQRNSWRLDLCTTLP